jgi:hypothetical protein
MNGKRDASILFPTNLNGSYQAWVRWKTWAISKTKYIVSVFEIAKSILINIVSKFCR